MDKKKKRFKQTLRQAVRTLPEKDFPSDVQGSYTGTGRQDDRPVQDVDDL